ncbi:MAG: hypothetical protein LBI71_06600 [Enterobacteriaceae bacterium]|jgi:RHS repeat-associated protein|nr:hypothetical protein [Enterobacteriaceae bacterium]
MSNDFFSQAANFQSTATGHVDPRTGLFNYVMPLAHLTGNHLLGPELTLALSYSPLNTDDLGFGIGFSLGLTQYDSQNRLLALSTGEQYKVYENDEQVFLRQYKQDVVRFEKDVAQNHYRVTHKSGLIEILTGPNNAFDLKVPVKIISPQGDYLTLAWDFSYGPTPHLVSVADQNTTLLTVDYEFGSYAQITVWPDSPEHYQVKVTLYNQYVDKITTTSGSQDLQWQLDYDPDCRFLDQITSPTGMKQQVDYARQGHRFPDNAHLPPLPYVTRYRQWAGQGVTHERAYDYTHSNFLGYGAGGDWSPHQDYLYGVMTDYQYGSTEHWDNGTEQRHITRTYNNYHLLVAENVQQNDCQRRHETTYYARTGQDFDSQPPQFQLPQSATVYLNNDRGQRAETTQTEFDTAGNPTVQTTPDGTRTEWTYYPAGGEADLCPADPHGFVRYVKTKTVIPAPDSYDDTPVHQVRYQYAKLSTRPGSLTDFAVVCTGQAVYSDGQLLSDSQTRYVDQPDQPHHGRAASVEETVYSGTGTGWTHRKTFSYSLTTGRLQSTAQWRGHDGLTASGTQVKSCASGKTLNEQDPLGCTVRYIYDALGRLLLQKDNDDTPYARGNQYEYGIEQANELTTTQEDVWGNQVRQRSDGCGQACQQEILAKGQEEAGWRTVSETARDSWGRVITQTQHDWLPLGSDPTQTEAVSVQQQTTYDNWGQPARVTDSTGKCLRQEYDPVTLTARSQTEADGLAFGYTETVYDLRQQPLTVTQFDSQGRQASQQRNVYDGLGRLRATVDALGQRTDYTYDLFSRIAVIRHSDGMAVRKHYAPFSSGHLLTQIEADGNVLGSREFDSLSRVTRTTVGGRTHTATYQGSNPAPVTVTDPLGQKSYQLHEPKLGNALLQLRATDIGQDFTYDATTGALVRAVADGQASRQLSYTSAGQLQQETVQFDGTGAGAARNAEYSYSPAGKLTAYRDFATAGETGQTRRLRFDTLGRPVELYDDTMRVALFYDAASRVSRWTVQDKRSPQPLTTTLAWDDLGRETGRRIESGADVLTLEQDYTVLGQLARRVTRSQQDGLLRQENYTYDAARRWLTDYQCEGAECPRDAYGMTLNRQQFRHDRLGNILTCITTLADGSQDTATFSYSPSDACQLQRITHTHPSYPAEITLDYDNAGRLIHDEAGRELAYDALGRLISATQDGNASRYGYDAAGRLALHRQNAQTQELYYQGSTRVMEIQRESGAQTRLVQANGATAAVITDAGASLLGTDPQGSVLLSQQGSGSPARYRYTPYGQQAADGQNPLLPGYTGERADPLGGGYHLGNGYRTYNPVLMRFTAPDSLSPFGAGGLNPYAYCLGDPVNRSDPSGHMSWGSIFGIGFGVIGLIAGLVMVIPTGGASLSIGAAIFAGVGFLGDATGIASAVTEESDPQASAILGWVSLGLGALSLGSEVLIGLVRGMRQVGERMIDSFSHGLSDVGAAQAGSSGSHAVAGGSLAARESRYAYHFRLIKNLGGREGLERIGDSRINNIHANWPAITSIVSRNEMPTIRNAFEKFGFVQYGRSNMWRLDTRTPLFDNIFGSHTHVNMSFETYEKLYVSFIKDITPSSHILSTNSLRAMINHHALNTEPFDIQTINMMKDWWTGCYYSGTFKDWIIADMTLRFPDRAQAILQAETMIHNENLTSFIDFFNYFLQ